MSRTQMFQKTQHARRWVWAMIGVSAAPPLMTCHSKTSSPTSSSDPASAESARAQPTATPPMRTVSAAEKVGMFAYPGNNQSRDQQLIDELDCYNSASQQPGVSPE